MISIILILVILAISGINNSLIYDNLLQTFKVLYDMNIMHYIY